MVDSEGKFGVRSSDPIAIGFGVQIKNR